MRSTRTRVPTKKLQQQVDAWNRANPVGVPVRVRRDDDSVQRSVTRGEAFVDQAGTSAVIMLEGISGYYLLDRVTAERRDGLGRPIDLDADYYVQDKRTIVGNCVSWWRANNAGYACDVDDAGMYKGREVLSMRDTDIPWPVEVVLRNTARYVDFQRLSTERERAQRPPMPEVTAETSP